MLLLSIEHKSEHSCLVYGNYLLEKKQLQVVAYDVMLYTSVCTLESSRKYSKDVNMSALSPVGITLELCISLLLCLLYHVISPVSCKLMVSRLAPEGPFCSLL